MEGSIGGGWRGGDGERLVISKYGSVFEGEGERFAVTVDSGTDTSSRVRLANH